MAESQTWRVVLAPRTLDGAAEERQLTVVWVERFGGSWTCGGHGYHRSPRRAAMMAAFTLDYDVAEILAPGEPTRAELVAELATATAQRNAAEVRGDDAEGELDVALAALRLRQSDCDVRDRQQAPLVACVDALRAAARAAGWRDADATGETLVAWVRRGEREACAARCERAAGSGR